MLKVSVIIPTFNRADLIGETLESVFSQTYSNIEVIVIDDGSTDNTPEVVGNFKNRLTFIRQENAGQGAARNAGIRASTGEFIAFLDSDDLWLPNKIEKQIARLSTNAETPWVYSDAECFDNRTGTPTNTISKMYKRLHSGWVGRNLILENFIASPTVVVKRELFEQVGYFNEAKILRCREDWELWLRIAARFPIALVPEVLARYREHENNGSRNEDSETARRGMFCAIKNAVNFAPEIYCALTFRAYSGVYFRLGTDQIWKGDFRKARNYLRKAVKLNPNPMVFGWYLLALGGPRVFKLKEFWIVRKGQATTK